METVWDREDAASEAPDQAVQAACAEKAEADYLVTRDKKGFQRSPVKTVTPAELLALIP